ncbi:hypothetical protein SNEBB_005833 [Seison nebaliae]|nr:hypothetical protein SNEBB_005833 [Seison nebaliae]
MGHSQEDFSQDQKEAIDKFQEIFPERKDGVRLLRKSHWNLTQALNLAVTVDISPDSETESDEDYDGDEFNEYSNNDNFNHNNNNPSENNSNEITPRSTLSTLISYISSLVVTPVQFTFSKLYQLFEYFLTFVHNPLPPITDPIGDSAKIVAQLASDAPQVDRRLSLYVGSFESARSAAKSSNKLLSVLIHEVGNTKSEDFYKRVLCSEDFYNFNVSTVLVWAADSKSPEGMRILRDNGCPSLPFFAVYAERGMDSIPTFVQFPIGDCSVEPHRFIRTITTVCAEMLMALEQRRKMQVDGINRDNLKKIQTDNFINSINADRKKEEEKILKKKLEQQRLNDEKWRYEEFVRLQEQYLKEIDEEDKEIEKRKNGLIIVDENGNAKSCGTSMNLGMLQFKFSDGMKVRRTFLWDEHSSKDLYKFVRSHKCAPADLQIRRTHPPTIVDENNEELLCDTNIKKNENYLVLDLDA